MLPSLYACAIGKICVTAMELCVLLRSFGCAFFVLRGGFVAEINTIKELHKLSEMNKIMLDVINECSGTCTDEETKERLIKVKEQVENISSKNNLICQSLTPEEAVIVLLLSFIREREMYRSGDAFDIDILNEAGGWLKGFK